MWFEAVQAGGPVMYGVLGAWLVVLAGVLDRVFYAVGRAVRRPSLRADALLRAGHREEAEALFASEASAARRSLDRIEDTSQLATSIGLFGTVLGIARGFLERGGSAAAEESLLALSEGLSTALFTTIGGLVVFLFGQGALIVYREWLAWCERGAASEATS
ncbi:MAG: MotA/TolQ/ExbB proton channel family protein [Planctomycetota bacterium]